MAVYMENTTVVPRSDVLFLDRQLCHVHALVRLGLVGLVDLVGLQTP